MNMKPKNTTTTTKIRNAETYDQRISTTSVRNELDSNVYRQIKKQRAANGSKLTDRYILVNNVIEHHKFVV